MGRKKKWEKGWEIDTINVGGGGKVKVTNFRPEPEGEVSGGPS
jgi:diaminopimelate decarboxylase